MTGYGDFPVWFRTISAVVLFPITSGRVGQVILGYSRESHRRIKPVINPSPLQPVPENLQARRQKDGHIECLLQATPWISLKKQVIALNNNNPGIWRDADGICNGDIPFPIKIWEEKFGFSRLHPCNSFTQPL